MFPKDHFGCSVENNCRDVNMGDGGGGQFGGFCKNSDVR